MLLWSTWNFLQDVLAVSHKTNLCKFKRTEVISSIFSDYQGMKRGINSKIKNEQYEKLNHTHLNSKENIMRKIIKHLQKNENVTQQNAWGPTTMAAGLTFAFYFGGGCRIAINMYIKKEKRLST